MQCFNPISLTADMEVPCGKCLACKINRSHEWALRIIHELSYWDCAVFLTLTYDDDHLCFKDVIKYGVRPTLIKSDLQKFFKRLRKTLYPKKIKYYACGEYGEYHKRPHYHAIIFGVGIKDTKMLNDLWNMGLVNCGTVTFDSARYVAGYIDKKYHGKLAVKEYTSKGLLIPFQICSQGFGLNFALDNADQLRRQLYTTIRGKKVPLPRYYKQKLNIDVDRLKEYHESKQDEYDMRVLNEGINTNEAKVKQIKSEHEHSEATVKAKVKLFQERNSKF